MTGMRSKRFRLVLSMAVLCLSAIVPARAEELPEINSGILKSYDAMHTALADDKNDGVQAAASAIQAQATAAAAKAKDPAGYKKVAEAAGAVGAKSAMNDQREALKALSIAIAKLVESGQLAGAGIYYCPMADGYWLQKAGDESLRNPYYGKSMLRCGDKVDKVEES